MKLKVAQVGSTPYWALLQTCASGNVMMKTKIIIALTLLFNCNLLNAQSVFTMSKKNTEITLIDSIYIYKNTRLIHTLKGEWNNLLILKSKTSRKGGLNEIENYKYLINMKYFNIKKYNWFKIFISCNYKYIYVYKNKLFMQIKLIEHKTKKNILCKYE